MSDNRLRVLVLAAHPDDAEYHVGGLLSLYADLGHEVRIISLTNGDAGHHETAGPPLAERRWEEATTAARRLGASFEAWDVPDGWLQPTLELRWRIIREIRTFQPDLVLTHRANDYHPDHRAAARGVQDASYMVTVPAIVPEVPFLRKDPVVAYMPDHFTRPQPLRADVVVDVSDRLDTIIELLACHESQVFEWLPFNRGILDEVPLDRRERLAWLERWYLEFKRPFTARYSDEILATYGPAESRGVTLVDVLEISEYATQLGGDSRRRLFPFLPE